MVVVTQVVEKVNVSDLYKLITNGTLSVDQKNMLKTIHKNILKDGYHTSKYHFADNGEDSKRLTAKGPGLQFLPGNARNYLLHKNYNEIDISNCATTILLNIMEQNEENFTQEEMEFISDYHANKKRWMEESDDAEKFKKKYLTVLFANANYSKHISNEQWFMFKKIRQQIVSLKKYKHIAETKGENCVGRKFSHIIFEHEKNIILSIKEYCVFNEIETGTIVFDAIFVEKYKEIDFEDLQEHIKQATSFDIKVKIKEVEEFDESSLFISDFDYEFGEKDEEEKEENIHDKIYNKFMCWAFENNLIRIKNTPVVMRKHLIEDGIKYAAEVMYTSFKDTIYAFQQSVIETDLFTGKFYEAKYKNIKSILDTESPSLYFPIVEADWKYFGYTNGVLNIMTNEFITKEKFKEDILVRKFLDIEYSITRPCHAFDKILEDQEFEQSTKEFLYILIGRIFYRLQTADRERYVLALIGATSTGKSTILSAILSVINSSQRTTIDTTSKDGFGLDNKNNKELLSCGEANKMIQVLGEEQFKSMAAGEEVEINGKFKDKKTENWTTPMLLCSNDPIEVKDKTGAIVGKRVQNFHFSNRIQSSDPNLGKKLIDNFKYSVGFFIDIYFKNKDNLCNIIPEQLESWNEDIKSDNDNFRQWIQADPEDLYYVVQYKKGSITKPENLVKSWEKHWKITLGNHGPPESIKTKGEAEHALKEIGINWKRVNYCNLCNNRFKRGSCTCVGEDYLNRRNNRLKMFWEHLEIVPGGLNANRELTIDKAGEDREVG